MTEIDEKEYISLRLIISELRNQYVSEKTALALASRTAAERAFLTPLLLLLSPFPMSTPSPGKEPVSSPLRFGSNEKSQLLPLHHLPEMQVFLTERSQDSSAKYSFHLCGNL